MCQDGKDSTRQHPAGRDPRPCCKPTVPCPESGNSSENPALKSKLIQGMQVPLEECIPEDKVVW